VERGGGGSFLSLSRDTRQDEGGKKGKVHGGGKKKKRKERGKERGSGAGPIVRPINQSIFPQLCFTNPVIDPTLEGRRKKGL